MGCQEHQERLEGVVMQAPHWKEMGQALRSSESCGRPRGPVGSQGIYAQRGLH